MTSSEIKGKTVRFDSSIYPAEALMGAAYKFLDRIYTHFEYSANGSKIIRARLKAKNKYSNTVWEKTVEEFKEEALSQALRLKILKATKKTRDQIMSIALYCIPSNEDALPQSEATAGPCAEEQLDAELEGILRKLREEPQDDDFTEDPMDITIPWEEKYGEIK